MKQLKTLHNLCIVQQKQGMMLKWNKWEHADDSFLGLWISRIQESYKLHAALKDGTLWGSKIKQTEPLFGLVWMLCLLV